MTYPIPPEYLNKAVFLDGILGTPGGNGTIDQPVDTIARATPIAVAQSYRNLVMPNFQTEALLQAYNRWRFIGDGTYGDILIQALQLNNQDVNFSEFDNLCLSGVNAGGGPIFVKGGIMAAVDSAGIFEDCIIFLFHTLRPSPVVVFKRCWAAGSLDCQYLAGGEQIFIQDMTGDLAIANLTLGATIYIQCPSGLRLTIDGTCTGGQIYISGQVMVTDNSAGTVVNRSPIEDGVLVQESMREFWSLSVSSTVLTSLGLTQALYDIVVAGIPTRATITRVEAIFKVRELSNVAVGSNSISPDQVIQVRPAAGAWVDAINFPDGMWYVPLMGQGSGGVCYGTLDLSGSVNANGTYNVQWLDATPFVDTLEFVDIQVGLRVYFRWLPT